MSRRKIDILACRIVSWKGDVHRCASKESADEFESRVERNQKRLEKEVRDRGVAISDRQENKTKTVLTALADAFRH
jgi:hypothetical protein